MQKKTKTNPKPKQKENCYVAKLTTSQLSPKTGPEVQIVPQRRAKRHMTKAGATQILLIEKAADRLRKGMT